MGILVSLRVAGSSNSLPPVHSDLPQRPADLCVESRGTGFIKSVSTNADEEEDEDVDEDEEDEDEDENEDSTSYPSRRSGNRMEV